MKKILTLLIILMSTLGQARPPDVGPLPELKFNPPEPQRVVLPNGVVLHLLEDHELPLFRLEMKIKMSPSDIPQDKIGTMSLFGTVWRSGGTKSRTPEKLNEELDFLPATIETGAGDDTIAANLSCLKWDIDSVLEIYKDVLLNPRFDSKQFSLAKAKSMEAIRRKNDNPVAISRRAFRDILYGPEHPYSYNMTKSVLKKARRGQLKNIHKKLVVPEHAIVSVWGDFKIDEMIEKLKKIFEEWPSTKRKVPEFDYTQIDPKEGDLFYVQKDGFSQSRIYIGNLGLSRHDPDQYALGVANYILGGGGASRLFAEIRSRLGLAYVVGSFYTAPTGPGMVGVGCQTKGETTLKTIRALNKELDKFCASPPLDEELSVAKDSIINAFVFQFESSQNIVNQQSYLEYRGYPKDYLKNYPNQIKAVTAKDILRVANKYYAKENRKIIVLGDKKKFEASLDEIGSVIEIPLEEIK